MKRVIQPIGKLQLTRPLSALHLSTWAQPPALRRGLPLTHTHCLSPDYDKILKTRWFKHRNLRLIVLETKKSKVKLPADSIPEEGSLPGLQTPAFLLCPCTAERVLGCLLSFLQGH